MVGRLGRCGGHQTQNSQESTNFERDMCDIEMDDLRKQVQQRGIHLSPRHVKYPFHI